MAPRNGLYRSDTGAADTFAWLDVSGDGAVVELDRKDLPGGGMDPVLVACLRRRVRGTTDAIAHSLKGKGIFVEFTGTLDAYLASGEQPLNAPQ